MTYSVLLQSTKKQGYNAIVLGFPFLRAEGATKKEALDKVQGLLASLMASGEIVEVEVEQPPIASLDEPLPEMGSAQMCSLRSPTPSAYGRPERHPAAQPDDILSARRFLPVLRHLNDLPVLASVLKARPDWFLSDNTEHFGTDLAGATGLNILTSVDFLHRLIVPSP